MFNKKTLIVVGAGASNEVKLPTGAQLKEKISSILDIRFEHGHEWISGDNVTYQAIVHAAQRSNVEINAHLHAAWRIRDAMPLAISIDNFIDAHQGDSKLELCGKLAIVRSILEAERSSLLYIDISNRETNLNYQSLKNSWFNAFIQLLTENCRVEQLEERLSSIEFIIFNYDRCVEHFLYNSLQIYYGINAEHAAKLVKGIKIYHPYGTVGNLPWYNQENAIEFGAKPSSTQLIDLAKQIKTFTEGTDPDSSDIIAIRNGMATSSIVLFLGFAYHRLNLELIKPISGTNLNPNEILYYGTAKGFSNSDTEIIKTDLVNLGCTRPENVTLRNNLNCYEFFNEHWRSLSLS